MKKKAIRRELRRQKKSKSQHSLRMIRLLEESFAGCAKMQTDLELFEIRRVNGYNQGIDEEPSQKLEEDNKKSMKSIKNAHPHAETESSGG